MKYFIRSVKYLLRLCVIAVVAIVIMRFTKLSSLTTEEVLFILTETTKGWLLLAVTIGSSAIYPMLGYRKYKLKGNIIENKNKIINAFVSVDCKLVSESDSELQFVEKNILDKSFKFITEKIADKITVTQEGDEITIEGRGKITYKVMSKMESYIS